MNKRNLKYILLLLLIIGQLKPVSAQWSKVGEGLTGASDGLNELYIYRDELYAGGEFRKSGHKTLNGIGRWNGLNWDSVGYGVTFGIDGPESFAIYNNKLYAGGDFGQMDSVDYTGMLAVWDGQQWASANISPSNVGPVHGLETYKDELYAGGRMTRIGGVDVNRIARWDGATWKTVGTGIDGPMPWLEEMCVYKDELYVGGNFNNAGGKEARNIARWNGTEWNEVDSGADGLVKAFVVDTVNNLLYVGGSFSSLGGKQNMNRVGCWNGTEWKSLGMGFSGYVHAFAMYRGQLYTGGEFIISGESDIIYLARWDGIKWNPVIGPNKAVRTLQVYKDTLYVGGYFNKIKDDSIRYLAGYFVPATGMDAAIPYMEYILGDCQPNPFSEQTVIPYRIPASVQQARLRITDVTGRTLALYTLSSDKERAVLSLQGYAKGMYLYILEIEGVPVETKRMILSK